MIAAIIIYVVKGAREYCKHILIVVYFICTKSDDCINILTIKELKYEEVDMENQNQIGHGKAVASLVLGIIGAIFWFFGYSSILSIILGIIGIVLSSMAKKEGNNEGIRTAGFVLSLIALIGGTIVFLACVACVGGLAAIGASMY